MKYIRIGDDIINLERVRNIRVVDGAIRFRFSRDHSVDFLEGVDCETYGIALAYVENELEYYEVVE